MMRKCVACAVLIVAGILAWAPPTGGQQETKKAIDSLWGLMKGVKQWKQEELARVAKDLQAQEADWRKFRLMTEAVVAKGENEYLEATKKLELAIQQYEASPADQRNTPKNKMVYSENLLELARLYALMCDYDKARKRVLQGWETRQAIAGLSHEGLALRIHGLLIVGTILNEIDQPHEAAKYVEKSLALIGTMPRQISDPTENPLLASCLLAWTETTNRTGHHYSARLVATQALEILTKTGHKLHPDRAAALHGLAMALIHLDEAPNALPHLQEARIILEDCYPKGHPSLAALHGTFAKVYHLSGKEPDTLASVQKAIDEYTRLFPESKYPRGHPGLIQVKTSLGDWLSQIDHKKEALALHHKAWQESLRFYVGPHENKLATLLSYGRSLRADGKIDDARTRFEEAEKMAHILDAKKPAGNVAVCLIQRGNVEAQLKLLPQARETFEQALALCRRTALQGHPQLSTVSQSLGAIYLKQGEPTKARSSFAQALTTDQQELARFASKAAEAEALAFARPRQLSFHGYLAAGQNQQDADNGYDLVWKAKATVTRLLQERRAATRLALEKSDDVRKLWEELVDTRTEMSRLTTSSREEPTVRNKSLAGLAEKKERLERELAQKLPDFNRQWEANTLGPADLARLLPKGSVFVDLIRYEDSLRHDPPQSCYAAFVVTPGGTPTRIDLGPALPIDEAVNAWRAAGLGWKRAPTPAAQQPWQDISDREAGTLRRLVWEKIAVHFAVGSRLIYLAPDGDLARFPFAALPGEKADTILLEEYLIAQVPHGPFLLDQLMHPAKNLEDGGRFLAVGAVMYGQPEAGSAHRFPFLEETVEEIGAAVNGAEPRDVLTLDGKKATSQAVREALQSAREAHVATHAFFLEKELTAEHRRIVEHLRAWSAATDFAASPVGLGRRLPLAYTGLALAGANQPSRAGLGGGILSGETIAELLLEKLRLVVLSACETGLGEHTAGEGVQGLVRAFHLAGCPNVVASLWRVDDVATRMLMTEFYRQMRQEKKSPLEALRLAQLAIHRPSPESNRSHPQLWAAFIYSGSGLPLSLELDDPRGWVRNPNPSTIAPEARASSANGLLVFASWSGGGLLALGAVAWLFLRTRLKT